MPLIEALRTQWVGLVLLLTLPGFIGWLITPVFTVCN